MAITINTPYRDLGTISSIGTGVNGPNTRINVTGTTVAADVDEGRELYIPTNEAGASGARTESRPLVGQGTGYYDIEYPFGSFPILDASGNDTLHGGAPSVGTEAGICHLPDDIDNGVDLIKVTDQLYRMPNGASLTINASGMLLVKNITMEFPSVYVDLNGILQFGQLDAEGNVINSANLIDISDNGGGAGNSSFGGFSFAGNQLSTLDDYGALRVYGGMLRADVPSTSNGLFWRIYRDGTATHFGQTCFVDVLHSGRVGGRLHLSDKSVIRNSKAQDQQSVVGIINTKSSDGLISGFELLNGTQCFYENWTISGGGDFFGLRFNPNTMYENTDSVAPRIVRAADQPSGTVFNNTRNFIDIDIAAAEEAESLGITFFRQDSTASQGNEIFLYNRLTVSIQGAQTGYRLRITNNSGAEVYDNIDVSSGSWPAQQLEYANLDIPDSTAASYNLSDFDNSAGPYKWNVRHYDFITQTGNYDAKLDENALAPKVSDADIAATGISKSTALSYTELTTGGRFAARWKAEHVDTDDLDGPTLGGGAISAVAKNGTNIDFDLVGGGYDIVLDATAGSAFSESSGTITIHADNIDVGDGVTVLRVAPNKTLTFANGATISLGVALPANASTTVADDTVIQGSLIMEGGTVSYNDLSGTQIARTGNTPTGIEDVSSVTGTKTLDMRGAPDDADLSGITIDNSGSGDITIKIGPNQTAPSLNNTGAGSLTIDSDVTHTINGLQAENYAVYDDSMVQQEYQTSVTGSTTFNAPASATGTWTLRVRRQGYTWTVTTFDPLVPQTFNIANTVMTDFDGNNLYQNSSTSLLLIDIAADRADIGNGSVLAQELYDESQDASVTSAGFAKDKTVDFVPTSNGNYIRLLGSFQLRRNTAGDANAELNAIVSADAANPVDTVNGDVRIQFDSQAEVLTILNKLDTMMELDGAGPNYQYTSDALDQAPTGGSAPTAAQVADAVWDEAKADHTAAGSFGEELGKVTNTETQAANAASSAASADGKLPADTTTKINRLDATVSSRASNSDMTAVKAKTDLLNFGTNNRVTADVRRVNDTAVTGVDDFKADVSALASQASVDALNDFDPANDTVANVTTVQTCVSNTDMRGTDGANTLPPDNIGIANAEAAAVAVDGRLPADPTSETNATSNTNSVLSAISGQNDLSISDVQTALDNQGYTSARAALLDLLTTINNSSEIIRKVQSNRVVINGSDTQVDVYEDDGTTIAFSFTVSGDKRERTPL